MPKAQLALFIVVWLLSAPLLHADEGTHSNETSLLGTMGMTQTILPAMAGDGVLKKDIFPTFHPFFGINLR